MSNVCCSIELEPRTLKQGQLIHAREIAADVVQKMKAEEAYTVFIKGLRPEKQMDQIEENKHQEDHHQEPVDYCHKDKGEDFESPCQCSVITSNIESPDQINIKEPLSAPF
ncbi:uncharacterized protein LOC8273799 [Ricinus communis]|uniref:uncharacterized protein LOC8273799 n=1 Tax=Ricinus communis TaxID=3988 RepID=UPI000772748E|nr:uncharacterized protein LOC8273799 [Ricinus communis]|eukprot:XP_015572831.1 uncharacterized protein LOC8273799 [Ricinus communis]